MSLRELHAKGGTREQIEGALKIMPFVRWMKIPLRHEHLSNPSQHPAMVRAVTTAKAKSNPRTTFLCLSNANSVFINTILKVTLSKLYRFVFSDHTLQEKGLDTLFDEIITNPAEWDPSGLLKLRRRVDPSGTQHTCQVGCSPNMCKGPRSFCFGSLYRTDLNLLTGEELEAFLARHQPAFDRVIYVGDGSNDYCPVLRLRR